MGRKKVSFVKDPFFYGMLAAFAFFIAFVFSIPDMVFAIIFFVCSVIFVMISILIKEIQCSKCKKLFYKILVKDEIINTNISPHSQIIETQYLYSNGNYKDSRFTEETIKEKIELHKLLYKCKYCKNQIIEYQKIGQSRLNSIEKIKTNEKEPKFCIICGKRLRSRNKYCSQCRPIGKPINSSE